MKRFVTVFLLFGFTLSLFLTIPSVHAQNTSMTEAHIARIKANCVDAGTQLNQIHATDALLRVNRGQLYERILTKLMSPFNSRVALNNLNGSTLVSISATYEQQLMAFRTDYQQYEEAMSATLKLNCVNQPVAFYDSVADTRGKREKVHEDTLQLHRSIQAYKDQFETFASANGGNS